MIEWLFNDITLRRIEIYLDIVNETYILKLILGTKLYMSVHIRVLLIRNVAILKQWYCSCIYIVPLLQKLHNLAFLHLFQNRYWILPLLFLEMQLFFFISSIFLYISLFFN